MKRIMTLVALFAVLVTFTQCKKAIEDLIDTTGTITFINPTYTNMDITFNGQTRVIAPGGSTSFDAEEFTTGTGLATTFGKTSSGAQIGLKMIWNLSYVFPDGGTTDDVTLNVDNNYFYLKLQNNSTKSIQKVYSNYGLVGQTLDNILIPNNGITYDLGYYQAFSNSNVRAESGTTFWTWNPLNLSFTQNQSKTLIAN